ncbi:MAG: hypothetical protein ACR2QF_03555 [Geminicoccaceae bacterium]
MSIETWKVVTPSANFAEYDQPMVSFRDDLPKPSRCLWKIGRFEVITDTLPNVERIGQVGELLVAGAVLPCALVGLEVSNAFNMTEVSSSYEKIYVQGPISVAIDVMILKDEYPSENAQEFVFEWRVGDGHGTLNMLDDLNGWPEFMQGATKPKEGAR